MYVLSRKLSRKAARQNKKRLLAANGVSCENWRRVWCARIQHAWQNITSEQGTTAERVRTGEQGSQRSDESRLQELKRFEVLTKIKGSAGTKEWVS
jgi:hypothetical protein